MHVIGSITCPFLVFLRLILELECRIICKSRVHWLISEFSDHAHDKIGHIFRFTKYSGRHWLILQTTCGSCDKICSNTIWLEAALLTKLRGSVVLLFCSTTDLLTISEAGVRTRDCFRFYTPCIEVDVAVESMSKTLLSMLSSDNVNDNTKIIARKAYPSMKQRPRRKIIGGLVFSGEYFWNHVFFNYCEIADFHDIFPDIPISGVTCDCQFGPPAVLPGGTDVERESTQGNVMGNFFSTTFFLFCTDWVFGFDLNLNRLQQWGGWKEGRSSRLYYSY